MDKKEILYWLDRYSEQGVCDKETELRLRKRIKSNKKLTKADLLEIIAWKFTGRLLGRRKLFSNMVNKLSENYIQNITEEALNLSSPYEAVSKLREIKGVGVALASCILAFNNPKDYCVYDIHLYDELFGTNAKTRPKDMFSNSKYYLDILEKLRNLSTKFNMNARDIEKALFQKNYSESNH